MLIRILFLIFFVSCSTSKSNLLSNDGQKKRLLIDKFDYLENKKLKPIAAGLTSTLTNGLSRIPALEVVGPSEKASALKLIKEKQLYGEEVDPAEFLSKITAADYFCNGDIQAEQSAALVNVRISDAQKGSLVLSSSTRGNLEKPITLQEKIVGNLLSNIDSNDAEANTALVSNSSTKNESAFSFYAQASDILYSEPQKAAILLISALKNDPEYLDALEDLANTLFQIGETKKSMEFLVRKKEVLERKQLQNTVDYANTLCNLGVTYFSLGEREKAMQLCLQDKELKESLKLKKTKLYANTLQTIASFHVYQGRYKEGIQLFESARTLLTTLGLDKTFDYADLLTSLGSAYKQNGEPEFAGGLYKDAENIYQEIGLSTTSSYAALLTNQGLLHLAKKEYKEALKKFIQDKSIQDKLGLGKSDGYITTLNNLAIVLSELGEKKKAIEFLQLANKLKSSKKKN